MIPPFIRWLMLLPLLPRQCTVGSQRWTETSSCGETSFTQPLQLPVHWLTWAPGREEHHQTQFDWTFPLKIQTLFALFSFFHSFGSEAKFKQRQIIAEKHLIVLMHTSLLNTAALWYCLCCSDLVLFVDLFSLICFLSFDFVRVCLEQCYIWEWMACLDGLGWHFWIVLVLWCLPKWMGAHLYMSLMP